MLSRLYRFFSYSYQHIKPAPAQKYFSRIKKIIRPGDVVVLRNYLFERIWPGYFSHAGVYLGSVNGELHQVIQVRGNGTVLIPLKEFLRAKEVAIVSPKLAESKLQAIVSRALLLVGRQYDFSFDFTRGNHLSCTELVYALYRRHLNLKLKKFLWKKIYIADQVFERGFRVRWISPGAKDVLADYLKKH